MSMGIRTSVVSLALIAAMAGCSTNKGTGALAGAGIGALVGVAAGDAQGALIGAAIGTGVGYIIGDQVDEQKAKELNAKGGTHQDVAPLSGTTWRLTSLTTSKQIPPYVSKVIEFRPDAHVITTTTHQDGRVEVFDESYRVVADTLIVNKPGYMINAKYVLTQDQLTLTDSAFTAVLARVQTTK